jgi:hypothetical protein
VFEDNDGYAIDINEYNYKNTFHSNQFINNNKGKKQAKDNGTENTWNSTERGNYWSDWTWPDFDLNGFVDDPYELDGSAGAKDHLPLTFKGSTEGGASGFLSRVRCRVVVLIVVIIGVVILAVIIIKVIRSRRKKETDEEEEELEEERVEAPP